MIRIIFAILIFCSAHHGPTAQAQELNQTPELNQAQDTDHADFRGYGYHRPGWGWWPIVVGGASYYNPYIYGQSYWPHWNYQPYYASYTAIAYDARTGRYGTAYGQSNLQLSSAIARNFCGTRNCQTVVWAQGGCVALTTSESGQRIGYAYGTYKHATTRNALRACERGGFTDCRTLAWSCSY